MPRLNAQQGFHGTARYSGVDEKNLPKGLHVVIVIATSQQIVEKNK